MLVAYLVPAEHIKPLQNSGNLSIYLASNYYIPADVLTSVEALRTFLLGMLSRIAAGVAIYIVAAVHVMGLLKSVENGEPFALENVKRLRRISLVLMIGSIIVPSVAASATAVASHINIAEIKSNSMFDLTLLLCGFLVLVLSGIFAYGARLQREHDQTV